MFSGLLTDSIGNSWMTNHQIIPCTIMHLELLEILLCTLNHCAPSCTKLLEVDSGAECIGGELVGKAMSRRGIGRRLYL